MDSGGRGETNQGREYLWEGKLGVDSEEDAFD